MIEGKIQTRTWDDRESGQKKYRTEILIYDLTLLGGRPKTNAAAPAGEVMPEREARALDMRNLRMARNTPIRASRPTTFRFELTAKFLNHQKGISDYFYCKGCELAKTRGCTLKYKGNRRSMLDFLRVNTHGLEWGSSSEPHEIRLSRSSALANAFRRGILRLHPKESEAITQATAQGESSGNWIYEERPFQTHGRED